ncbi:MAG TPA: hypothetical protein VGR02_14470 [Thermoanaerobaculia bacterium]|nr:hypothetical protein [Thermoanaerobaculia bacterium]
MLQRVLAIVLLLVSLITFVPLIMAALRLARGFQVDPMAWWAPLLILATSALLTWLLSRRFASMRLFVVAFALWLVTAGYLLLQLRWLM